MAHAENSIVINRPPQTVYAFLADGLNNMKWRDGVAEISLKDGEGGKVGAEYRQLLKGPGGRMVEGDYRLTAAEPPRRLAFDVIAGPAHPHGEYLLEATVGGTQVHFSLSLKPRGFMRLVAPMIVKTMQSEVAKLSTLKRVLER